MKYPVYHNDFSLIVKYKLLNKTANDLSRYMDVSVELANRIINQLNNFFNYKQFCGCLRQKKSPRPALTAPFFTSCWASKRTVWKNIEGGLSLLRPSSGLPQRPRRILGSVVKNGTLPLLTSLYETDDIPKSGRKCSITIYSRQTYIHPSSRINSRRHSLMSIGRGY